MRTLLLALILIATPALAADRVVIDWEYDHQDIPDYAIDTITVEVDGEQKCSDNTPVTDTSTGKWIYACPWSFFEPGVHQVRLIFTDITGINTFSNYEQITIEDPPPELPDRIDPIITGHEVIIET